MTADALPPPIPVFESLAIVFAPMGRWVEQAACAERGTDPTMFDAPGPDDWTAHGSAGVAARQREAAAMCARCPVRQECLQDAIDNNLAGIRGGVLITARHGAQFDLIALASEGKLLRPAGFGRPTGQVAAA
jgi:hypothetical protein